MGKRRRQGKRDDSNNMSEQELHDKAKMLKGRVDLCQRLHDAVRRIRGKSGHPKCEFLCRLPSRRSNPDYYEMITDPISLNDIEQKLKTGRYGSVGSFVDDMELMFNNARTFYEVGSQENTDAELLQEEFTTELRCILKEEEEDKDETCSPESKRLKLKISHGKVVSSSVDKEGCSKEDGSHDTAKEEGEGLIVQIKLQDTSTLSTREESWKPKREKQRKDYAELFGQRKKISEEEKEKMQEIYDLIVNEKDEDDLPMCEPFMIKPSIRKYPHYYVVIKRPIDLKEIKEKIDNDKYFSIERFMADINILFRNAKFFNEESSTIYEYADQLHKIAKTKYQQLTNPAGVCPPPVPSATPSPAPPTSEPVTVTKDEPINPSVGAMFDAIKTFTSPDGKTLWETFKSLPNKLVNTDYYTVIKQPIDMVIIATKLLAREYPDVEEIFNDFVLLFDNACRYYKPYTDHYKNAVMLHRALVEKREQLIERQPPSISVPKLVQGIFRNLLKTVMQYKDPVSGRRLSDNIWVAPLQERKEECNDNDDNSSVISVTDLITIERRTIKVVCGCSSNEYGLYCRLDILQDDVMGLLKHVQLTSTPDNQIYQDAVKLQKVFLQERDRLCHNGKLLWSPAFPQHSLEQLQQQQAEVITALELADNGENDAESDDMLTEDCREYIECIEFSGTSYSVGDVVYVSPKKTGSYLPHIVAIEKLWMDKNSGDHWFSGSWFYQPEETFHVPTKRFIINEVFCTNRHQMVRLRRVTGKCCVLRYKDYCKNTVEGFDEEHMYVCRDRYHIQMKSFRPVKNWGAIGRHWVLVPRQQPMKLDYVYSKFASSELIVKLEARRGNQLETVPESVPMTERMDSSELNNDEDNEMDEIASISSVELEEFHVEYDNILSKDQSGVDAGCCSYDQYCLDHYCFRLGDYVYLRSDKQLPFIARIEKMWTDQNGDPWFHGCWFLRPSETIHLPTHMFYTNELLMSNIADTNPMRSVIGKCVVLTLKEFCTWRPTEIDEKDVYLCEERYNEHDKDFKKLKGLKKLPLSPEAVADEIYYFKEEIVPNKEPSPQLFSLPSKAEIIANENSDSVVIENASSMNMESSTYDINDDQQPSTGVQPITLFALDLQSQLRSRGTEMTLANVIQAAKNEWLKLSPEQQADYQLRAAELSLLLPSTAVAPNNTNQPINKPPSVATPTTPTYTRSAYVCYWDGCGMQFTDVAGLFAHVTNMGPATHIKKEGVSNYYCEWRNCHRHKRCGGKPFNTQAKMLRHLKEVHMGRAIKEKISSTPQWQSKDCSGTSTPTAPTEPAVLPKLSTVLPAVPLVSTSTAAITMGTNAITTADTVTTNSTDILPSVNAHQQQKSTTSLVDSNKQASHLLHTTVYTRYIEGLRQNKQHMSNWNSSQSIQQQGMTHVQPNLQTNTWVSSKAAPNNKNLVDALYQLRDYLLQDTAKLSKYLSTTK